MLIDDYFCVVAGHEGKLIFGTIGTTNVPVVLLVGRAQLVASLTSQIQKSYAEQKLIISLLL